MARTSEQRKAKYDTKLVPSRVKTDLENQAASMRSGMNSVIDSQVSLDAATRGVLSGETVLTPDYPIYLGFIRGLAVKQTNMGGSALKAYGDARIVYLAAISPATTPILKKCALEVLGITLT
jgi:hypothetical protein